MSFRQENPNTQLRHLLAAFAFRASVALQDYPQGAQIFQAGQGVQTPLSLLAHLVALLRTGHSILDRQDPFVAFDTYAASDWAAALQDLQAAIQTLDTDLQITSTMAPACEHVLMQGTLADGFAHVGQLLTLRRLAGSPAKSVESYRKAVVEAGVFPAYS